MQVYSIISKEEGSTINILGITAMAVKKKWCFLLLVGNSRCVSGFIPQWFKEHQFQSNPPIWHMAQNSNLLNQLRFDEQLCTMMYYELCLMLMPCCSSEFIYDGEE